LTEKESDRPSRHRPYTLRLAIVAPVFASKRLNRFTLRSDAWCTTSIVARIMAMQSEKNKARKYDSMII